MVFLVNRAYHDDKLWNSEHDQETLEAIERSRSCTGWEEVSSWSTYLPGFSYVKPS